MPTVSTVSPLMITYILPQLQKDQIYRTLLFVHFWDHFPFQLISWFLFRDLQFFSNLLSTLYKLPMRNFSSVSCSDLFFQRPEEFCTVNTYCHLFLLTPFSTPLMKIWEHMSKEWSLGDSIPCISLVSFSKTVYL